MTASGGRSGRHFSSSRESKPNLTYSDLSCQVWVLSGTFLGFGGGTGTVDVSAAHFLLRQQFGAIFAGSQALGLRVAPAKRQPQICCCAGAVGRSLVAHFAVIGARLGDLPWRLPGRFRASRAPRIPQIAALPRTKSQSKPNLTYSDLSCQVWVLSLAFPGFGGGQVSFRVCAAKTKMRPRFGAIFTGSQAAGLRIAPAEPQPQICSGARAVGKTLVANAAVIWARLGECL